MKYSFDGQCTMFGSCSVDKFGASGQYGKLIFGAPDSQICHIERAPTIVRSVHQDIYSLIVTTEVCAPICAPEVLLCTGLSGAQRFLSILACSRLVYIHDNQMFAIKNSP